VSSDLDEFKKQQDTSSWRLTEWIQVGEAKWRKQAEKFWRVPASNVIALWALKRGWVDLRVQ